MTGAALLPRLRRGLLLLGAAGTAGTAIELAMLRHWTSATQLLAWVALVPLVAALALLCTGSGNTAARRARWLLGGVTALALYGVVTHVQANVAAGVLDFRFADRWDTMSTAARWWEAATGGVGPSPTLAPAIYAQAAACLWLASMIEAAPAVNRREAPRGTIGAGARPR